jgi:hypothetical protein
MNLAAIVVGRTILRDSDETDHFVPDTRAVDRGHHVVRNLDQAVDVLDYAAAVGILQPMTIP